MHDDVGVATSKPLEDAAVGGEPGAAGFLHVVLGERKSEGVRLHLMTPSKVGFGHDHQERFRSGIFSIVAVESNGSLARVSRNRTMDLGPTFSQSS